ncbi:MAG: hypothetical protein E3J72_15455 [Planctomycetota bacterium]|nr:MAG: hypothetical protein E3J72_15455 [Planctomycetota bacterium]
MKFNLLSKYSRRPSLIGRINLLADYSVERPAASRIDLLSGYRKQRASSLQINLLADYSRVRASMAFIAAAVLGAALIIANLFGAFAGLTAFLLLVLLLAFPLLPPARRIITISKRIFTRPAHFL